MAKDVKCDVPGCDEDKSYSYKGHRKVRGELERVELAICWFHWERHNSDKYAFDIKRKFNLVDEPVPVNEWDNEPADCGPDCTHCAEARALHGTRKRVARKRQPVEVAVEPDPDPDPEPEIAKVNEAGITIPNRGRRRRRRKS